MTAVIAGAGLAGLSAAYHLGGRCRVLEKEARPGGLCRTDTADGFTFDRAGHLLHFRTQEGRRLVDGLLPGQLSVHRRRSVVFMQGRFVPCPVQANLGALPPAVGRQCLDGFREAQRVRREDAGCSFETWVRRTFGDALAEAFFLPYGRKFWGVPLGELDSAWAGRFIPVPSVEEVEAGARGAVAADMGYNAEFSYPRRGGIEALACALARGAGRVETGVRLAAVSPLRRELTLESGETMRYGTLVSTVPLPELVSMMGAEAPAGAAARLRATSITVVNLGVRGTGRTDWHWVYFPGEEFVFYRVGFYSSFSAHMAPDGMRALYAEVSHGTGEQNGDGPVTARVTADLVRAGMLESADDVVTSRVEKIHPAYAVCDRERARSVTVIRAFLEEHGILSIGRSGRWDYLTMEDAILDGRRAAERIADGAGRRVPSHGGT